MSNTDAVSLEIEEGIAYVTMTQPHSLNALNTFMLAGLHAAFSEIIEKQQKIHIVVLRGSEGNFMAGGDLALFAQKLQNQQDDFSGEMQQAQSLIHLIKSLPLPVIAATEGAVAGYGVSLALACDLIYASETCFFSMAYSLIGITPDGGATWSLPREIGLKHAMEMCLTGDRYPAETLLSMGLINQIFPLKDFNRLVQIKAKKLAQGPKDAYAQTKRLLNQSSVTNLSDQLDDEADTFLAGTKTANFHEGVTAFLEKRAPYFNKETKEKA